MNNNRLGGKKAIYRRNFIFNDIYISTLPLFFYQCIPSAQKRNIYILYF